MGFGGVDLEFCGVFNTCATATISYFDSVGDQRRVVWLLGLEKGLVGGIAVLGIYNCHC